MEKYTCIVIDDEPIAINILETYIARLPFLDLRQTFHSPLQAFAYLRQHTVDLVFVDINMPELSGLQLIGTVQARSKFIITTAYREYALEGFELAVVDYLVKPFSYERFLKAIARAFQQPELERPVRDINLSHNLLFIKQDKKFIRIQMSEVLYLESHKDYIELIMSDKKYLTRETLSYFDMVLPEDRFARIHRRYIVALQAISFIKENDVYLQNGVMLPIGKTYKDVLASRLHLR